MLARLRLLLFAGIGGVLSGLAGYAFLEALDWATRTRVEQPWLVWLLPLAGLVIVGVYFYRGGRAKGGTPAVIEQGNVYTHGVGPGMAPLIFGGSVAGHLVGASVGREGGALQLAGSVTDTAASLGRLPAEDRRILVAASLAAGWGAVFGVPFTGIAFAVQVTRKRPLRVFLPAVIAAFSAQAVVAWLGYERAKSPTPSVDWDLWLPVQFVLIGFAVGLAGRLFVSSIMAIRRAMGHFVRWPPARGMIGGLATLALMIMTGRQYFGLSIPLLQASLVGVPMDWWVPVLKLVFTAIALGTGFVGGEVLPLFVIGGTLGNAVAPAINADRALMAAAGFPAAFSSAATVIVTGIVLTVEQFGWSMLVPALIVGAAARMAAGEPGLYLHHH